MDVVVLVAALLHARSLSPLARKAVLVCLLETEDKGFRAKLSAEAKRRRDRRIPRCALLDPIRDETPWRRLYRSGSNQAMITMTGLDYNTFNRLLGMFGPLFESHTPYSEDGCIEQKSEAQRHRGRPRKITPQIGLALVLVWTRTKGALYSLQGFFGLTGSPASTWLVFGRKVLLAVLKSMDDVQIKMPDDTRLQEYAAMIGGKYPSLKDCFSVCDGLKLLLESAGDPTIQNMFYNGWTHDTYVSSVFVFGPDGMIISCVTNVPGSVHDSAMAQWGEPSIYERLMAVYNRIGLRCVMDSAFCASSYPCILKSSQSHLGAADGAEMVRLRQATSMRQAAEWGMRAIQGSFPRTKERLRYEEFGQRRDILECIIYLYNYRCKNVGLNQLRSVFEPELSRDADYFLNNF